MNSCFITTDFQRPYLLKLTQNALIECGYPPKFVVKPMLERYFECDRLAETDIYIMSDDDIIPATEYALDELIHLLERHPEYSHIGLGWHKDMSFEKDNGNIMHKDSDDLWEWNACGGIMAIRKGTIKDLGYECDYPNGIGDDKIIGRIARELGYKVGVANNVWFHHMGAPYKTVWDRHYRIE